jgi:hypothetical protein
MKLLFKRNLPFLWALLCVAGCVDVTGSEGPAPTPHALTFSHDVAPIFAQSCVFCHHLGNATAIDFTHPFDPEKGIIRRANSWVSAKSTMVVDPGNVANSFLIDKVERSDLDPHVEGSRMPWAPPRVTADEVAAVRQWITDGAKDDAFYQENIATLFGDGKSLGTQGGKCGYCHYENTYQLPDLTHPFDPNVGIVDVAGSKGVKLVAPGDPDGSVLVQKIEARDGVDGGADLGAPMPMQFPLLTQPEIDTLKAWIAAGALDD